jgi:O-methyltransferase involved in polyketide biosynthesis
VVDVARASRQFLIRSVRYLAGEAGIRQFLDAGTGLPTGDNTHEVAQRVAPQSRIVYVDNDPMVLAHGRALLVSAPEGRSVYIDADVRGPDRILAAAAQTLELSQPVGLILSGVLGHVADDDEARAIVARLLGGLAPGSYLSLNDGTSVVASEAIEQAQQSYDDTGAVPYKLRSPAEIASFFDGLELVDPGVVTCPQWRPNADTTGPAEVDAWGGVGGKP